MFQCDMSEGIIRWPTAKEGDIFRYLCPISGCFWIYYVRFMGTWQFLKRE